MNAIYAWVLQHPLMPQALNDKRQQLLHICAIHNAHRLARYVLKLTQSPSMQNSRLHTALCGLSSHVAMVELLHPGANLNLQHTTHRKTALHHACEEDYLGDHHGVIHVFVSYGADLKLVDAEGRMPLKMLSHPFSVKNITPRFATKQTLPLQQEATEALNAEQWAAHTHAMPLPIAQQSYIPPQCVDVQPVMARVFCVELMAIPSSQLTSSEKQLLLVVAQQCFQQQPMQETDPTEWLVMTQYIRKTFGSNMLYRLFVHHTTSKPVTSEEP